jgi:hypothetical protein
MAPEVLRDKLEAAKKYLGKKLTTHPQSIYRVNRTTILDDWASTVVGVKTTMAPKPAPSDPVGLIDRWRAARILQK